MLDVFSTSAYRQLPLSVRYALVQGMRIPEASPASLDDLTEEAFVVANRWTAEAIRTHPSIQSLEQIYRDLGYDDGAITPAAQSFIELLQKRGRFPRINTAVDAYNTIVAMSPALVGIGAHDADLIQSPVLFARATGAERFMPLGRTKPRAVKKGDFLYHDGHGNVLARLAAQDCDGAKIQRDTRNVLLVIESPTTIEKEIVRDVMEAACSRIVRFCGGDVVVVGEPRPAHEPRTTQS